MKKAPFPQSIEEHNIYGKKYIPGDDAAMSPAIGRQIHASREAAQECSPGRKPWVGRVAKAQPQRGERTAS
jgi:hypothetical protein